MKMCATLTARQARFVEEYLIDGNGTAAAIRAGYAAAGAHVTASRTLRDPKVAEAIREGQAGKAAEAKIDRQAVLDRLQTAYESARVQAQPAAMVAAAREIGRLCGLYEPERRGVAARPSEAADGLQARFEAMPDAELEAIASGSS